MEAQWKRPCSLTGWLELQLQEFYLRSGLSFLLSPSTLPSRCIPSRHLLELSRLHTYAFHPTMTVPAASFTRRDRVQDLSILRIAATMRSDDGDIDKIRDELHDNLHERLEHASWGILGVLHDSFRSFRNICALRQDIQTLKLPGILFPVQIEHHKRVDHTSWRIFGYPRSTLGVTWRCQTNAPQV